MAKQQKQSESFNAIANKVATDLQRFEKAIPTLKDMQNWGKDSEGAYFTFEAAYDTLASQTILVGTLNNCYSTGGESPTLFVGLQADSDAPEGTEFLVAQTWTDPSKSVKKRIRDAYYNPGITRYCSAATVDHAVASFAEGHMSNNPGFKKLLQNAAQEFINKIPAKTPATKG